MFQQARKTFRDVPRHKTLKPPSRLASPFNQTIDIDDLNRRTHSYDGMYQTHTENMYSDKQGWFRVLVASISEWIPQKPLEDPSEADRGGRERLRQLLSNSQGKIHTKKKDSGKSTHNNRQKAKVSKGKAPDIQNYGQVELDYSSEADSEVQRLYFQEIENRKGLEQQGVVFS